jgi:hypothetical protein
MTSLLIADHHLVAQPYFQPNPAPPAPFTINSSFKDPNFNGISASWALKVVDSTDIIVFGKRYWLNWGGLLWLTGSLSV